MTLAQALALPHGRRVLLARVRAAERLVGWVYEGSYIWRATLSYPASGYRVESLEADGAALDSGDWNWDGSGTVRFDERALSAPVDPGQHVLAAVVAFRWANRAKTFSSIPWESRLAGVPKTSLRVEETFGDVGQIGGGTLDLLAGDGLFDSLTALTWRDVSLYLGKDV